MLKNPHTWINSYRLKEVSFVYDSLDILHIFLVSTLIAQTVKA